MEELLVQSPSADTIRGLDEISDTVRAQDGCPELVHIYSSCLYNSSTSEGHLTAWKE